MRSAWADGRAGAAVAGAVALSCAHAAAAARDARGPDLVGDWSRAEREAVDAAVERVPPAVRARLPRSVARDARRCGPDGWPEDELLLDGANHVHLCPGTAASPAAVARQVAGALLFGFDRASGWSEDAAWRRLNRWASPMVGAARAGNVAPSGFAEERGRRSPRWDLTTTLEATWLEPADASGGVSCRLMSQAAFVRARLAALSGTPVPAPRCTDFERWADLDHLADVEVVLAAPSTAMVGSLFGHLFLRLVYRDEDGATPPHLSRTVAFLADNDVPFEADRGYAWKGITGFYTASLHERLFLDAFREYAVTEGRDLRRWRVTLTEAERAALMARIWTVTGAGQYAYYFFRQNCATLMMDLIDDALPPGRAVGHAGLVASPPASTLEAWAETRGPDGRPILTFVPDPLLSFDHEARLTSRHRAELEPRIVAGSPAGVRGALAAAFREARAPSPARRSDAYLRLASILSPTSAGAPDDVYAWMRDSAAVESHLSVVSNLQAEARADADRRARVRAARDELARELRAQAASRGDAALGLAVARVGDDEPERRMEGYRALSALAADPKLGPEVESRLRRLALLESEARYDVARLKREPALRDALLFPDPDLPVTEQAYLRGRADLMRVPVVTEISPPLRSLQRAKEILFAARGLAPVALAAPTEVAPAADAVAAGAEYQASLHRSGIDQAGVSAGALAGSGAAAPLVPVLGLGGALYDERLGDHRRFGFPSDTAFVVARSEAWLGRGPGGAAALALLAYEARAFGYRSLRLPLPEADAGRLPLGWEAFVDVRGNRARALGTEVEAAWGMLARVVDRGELAEHVIVALDVAYVGAFPTSSAVTNDKPQELAVPLALELRKGLGARPAHRSWLAARVAAEPALVFAGAPRQLALEARGEAEAHVALRSRTSEGAHDPALLVRAQILRTSLSFTQARADTAALLSLGIELR